jgi:hypothetical protein
MDLKNSEWEYDCKDTDNKFSNLPPEMQKWAREQAEKAFGPKKPEKADIPEKSGG